jgi:hypothetical protein
VGGARRPRKIIGQYIDRDRGEAQENADPKQRRMMNARPVPNSGRASMAILHIRLAASFSIDAGIRDDAKQAKTARLS